MVDRSLSRLEFAPRAKEGIFERVLAPLAIFLVTIASLVILVFLGSRAMSCASHISAQFAEGTPQAIVHANPGE